MMWQDLNSNLAPSIEMLLAKKVTLWECKCQHEVFFGGCFYLKIACYLKKQKNAYWVGILSEGAIIILCTNVLTRDS